MNILPILEMIPVLGMSVSVLREKMHEDSLFKDYYFAFLLYHTGSVVFIACKFAQ